MTKFFNFFNLLAKSLFVVMKREIKPCIFFLTLRQNIFPLLQLINDLLAHRARKANGLRDDLLKHYSASATNMEHKNMGMGISASR